jgi:hypothetical protein
MSKLKDRLLNPEWVKQIREQASKLEADEEHLHNNLLHKQILTTWQEHSPTMWRRLEAAGLTQPLAMVLQARMWDRQEELLRAGLPVTDAREQAEKEILMLEPEAQVPPRLPEASLTTEA